MQCPTSNCSPAEVSPGIILHLCYKPINCITFKVMLKQIPQSVFQVRIWVNKLNVFRNSICANRIDIDG